MNLFLNATHMRPIKTIMGSSKQPKLSLWLGTFLWRKDQTLFSPWFKSNELIQILIGMALHSRRKEGLDRQRAHFADGDDIWIVSSIRPTTISLTLSLSWACREGILRNTYPCRGTSLLGLEILHLHGLVTLYSCCCTVLPYLAWVQHNCFANIISGPSICLRGRVTFDTTVLFQCLVKHLS